jgi:hypothetical protein
MKIINQNIYGGNQQFADQIINSKENSINESERELLNLIYSNNNSTTEREKLVSSLNAIKNDAVQDSEKKVSKNFLAKFLETIPGEVGKQVVKHLIDNGADYLQYLI